MLLDKNNNDKDNINIPNISESGGREYIIVAGLIRGSKANRKDCI